MNLMIFLIRKVDELINIVLQSNYNGTKDSSFFLNKLPNPKTSFNFHLLIVKDIEKAIDKMNSRLKLYVRTSSNSLM